MENENNVDIWTHLSTKVGLDRQKLKEVILEYFFTEISLFELLKKHKLRAHTFKHIILEIDLWTGAEE